jgi:hypothetical protein
MRSAINNCPNTIATNVDVVPIRGTRKIGAARIATPSAPPTYRYHSDSPGKDWNLAVPGNNRISARRKPILTTVRIRTEPKLPIR